MPGGNVKRSRMLVTRINKTVTNVLQLSQTIFVSNIRTFWLNQSFRILFNYLNEYLHDVQKDNFELGKGK